MFINVYIQFTQGPHAGEEMPITCLGERNLLFRLDEVAGVPGVEVVRVETAGELSEDTEDRVRALLAKRVDGGRDGH